MILQTDPAWVPARVGHLTGSRMADALDFTKKGEEGAKRRKLKIEILSERIANFATDHYVTADMQWGIDNEAHAADAYEAVTGNILTPSGFITHPSIEFFGASPDRQLDSDGLAEIKCPRTSTHIEWKLAGVVPDQHKPQMLAQLACTGRRYVDFISFDPRLPPKQQLFIRRFEPTRAQIEEIEEAARKFLDEVEQMFRQLTES